LESLKEKYNFNLISNTNRTNIAKNFCQAIKTIPDNYKYYIKFDSDIELLTEDTIKQASEVFDLKNKRTSKVAGVTPRIEGVFAFERYPNDIEYYNGHAVRCRTSVGFGCCMMFTNEVFKMFKSEAELILSADNDIKWGIDTKLYNTILSFGNFVVIEDLSVYHIDNSFGQRKDFEYFTQRKRWDKIDYEDVWCLKASKILYPRFFTKDEYNKIMKISEDFNSFIRNCYIYDKDKSRVDIEIEEKEKLKPKVEEVKKPIFLKRMYKVSSPLNFRTVPQITPGCFKYYLEVPEWAKNNPRVVVELENVEYTEELKDTVEFIEK